MFKRLYRLQLKYETETKHNIKETVPQDSQHIFFALWNFKLGYVHVCIVNNYADTEF